MDDRAQIFEALTELYESRTVDDKARRARSRERSTWRWIVHRLGFGCRGAAANVNLKTKHAEVIEDLVEARYEIITRVEEELEIVGKEGSQDLKVLGVPLAGQTFAHGNAAFAGLEIKRALSPARHDLKDASHQTRPKIDAGDASFFMGSINETRQD